MAEFKKIQELNRKSLNLSDTELAYVDKFSVLLPLKDLPEIIVTSDANQELPTPNLSASHPVVIPFPTRANPRGRVSSDYSEEKSPESVGKSQGTSVVAGNTDTKRNPLNDPVEPLAVEFPKDELSITPEKSTAAFPDGEAVDSEVTEDQYEEAIFDIGRFSRRDEHFESAAGKIDLGLKESGSSLIVLAAAEASDDQSVVFHSLLQALASKKPDSKIIGIQGYESSNAVTDWTVGLGNVLAEEHLLEEVVIPTSLENLDYLAFTNNELSNASFRNRVQRTLEELMDHYDVVFLNGDIATSPETAAVAEIADSVYLLIQLSSAAQETVVQAVDQLRKKGARLSGCILASHQREAS